jgi:hypothetical protein
MYPVVDDGGDARSCREATILDVPGTERGTVGACGVRLPVSSAEPMDGFTPAVRAVWLSDHQADRGRPARRCEQSGNIFQSEGASLSVRVSGAYLHPRLRRSASSWTGSSLRSSRVRGMRRSDTVGTAGLIGPHARRLAVDGASGPPTPALVGHRPPTRPEKLRSTMVPGTSRVAPDPWCDACVAGGR